MHEAEILCDRVAIVSSGKLLALGSPKSLIDTHARGFVGVFAKSIEHDEKILKIAASNPDVHSNTDGANAYLRAPSLEELSRLIEREGLSALQLRPANLEDVFLKLTGRELVNEA
jgi:lipooligosaccharide transport system ATP-binding protein